MSLRILFACEGFFSIPLKKVEIESDPVTDRTYFVHKGRIVAVATRGENR